jgi:phage-related minor tail protein
MEGNIEDLPHEIIEDLKQKAIERTGDDSDNIENNIDEELKDVEDSPNPPVVEDEPVKQVKKPKRQRSEKQKAAFEKARQKRAENLKIKKQLEAEKKEKQKKEKEQIKEQVKQRIEEQKAPAPVSNIRFQDEQPRYREQVVNNYYYYGHLPPQSSAQLERYPSYVMEQPEPPPVKRGRKKKVKQPEPEPETESESEEEEVIDYGPPEEPQSFKELQNYTEEIERVDNRPPAHPKLKFRFA